MRIHAFPRRLLAAVMLALPALPAAAVNLELQVGRSYMDSYGANAIFLESVFDEHRLGDSNFSWSPDVSLGWINGRDISQYEHCRYGTREDSWLVAAGVRLHYGSANDWYHPLFFSFQPAYHDGRTQSLSTGYEFVSTLGWQAKHWSFQIRHVSNGSLHYPNRGETMALVGLGFDL